MCCGRLLVSLVSLLLQILGVPVCYLAVSGFCSQVVWGLLRFPFKLGELSKQCLWGCLLEQAPDMCSGSCQVLLEAGGKALTVWHGSTATVPRRSRADLWAIGCFHRSSVLQVKYISDWILASQFIKHSDIIETLGSLSSELVVFLILEFLWKVKVAQSCLTFCDPMDYTVIGILWAGILVWVAVPFSKGSSQPRNWTQVFPIAGGFFTSWATREALESLYCVIY